MVFGRLSLGEGIEYLEETSRRMTIVANERDRDSGSQRLNKFWIWFDQIYGYVSGLGGNT